MKRTILTALIILALSSQAFAGGRHHRPRPVAETQEAIHNTLGAKVDAPNLIKFTDDLTLGVEGGKNIATNLFYPDSSSYIEADQGYFGYLKLTYVGNIFDFSKK